MCFRAQGAVEFKVLSNIQIFFFKNISDSPFIFSKSELLRVPNKITCPDSLSLGGHGQVHLESPRTNFHIRGDVELFDPFDLLLMEGWVNACNWPFKVF